MKAPFDWSPATERSLAGLCVARWGIRFRSDDAHRLRHIAEAAYLASADPTVAAFVQRIAALSDDEPELQAFVAQLVVGETSFFRYRPQFDALRSSILPSIIDGRRAERRHVLRIWSAGCASGEEPYSMAMLVASILPDWREWDVRIVGTDINPYALRRARMARYGDWSFRGVDSETIDTFFRPAGPRARYLAHDCRDLVTFRVHNLATDPIPDPALGLDCLDVILCRNVMIYFDTSLMSTLVTGFHAALADGGWLLVGHTEPDPDVFRQLQAVEFPETLVYRKPGGTVRAVSHPAASPAAPAAASPAEPVVPTLDEARSAYDAHDHAGAAEILLALVSRGSDDPAAPHLLAQLAADEKRYDEALFWSFRALLRDRFHASTLMLMALVWLERGDAARARDLLQQAIFNDPRAPEAHLYLSMAHRALGNSAQAERSRERAARLARQGTADVAAGPLFPVQRARLILIDAATAPEREVD